MAAHIPFPKSISQDILMVWVSSLWTDMSNNRAYESDLLLKTEAWMLVVSLPLTLDFLFFVVCVCVCVCLDLIFLEQF